jgi:hypothetical protein
MPVVEITNFNITEILLIFLSGLPDACFVDGESQVKLRTLSRHYM